MAVVMRPTVPPAHPSRHGLSGLRRTVGDSSRPSRRLGGASPSGATMFRIRIVLLAAALVASLVPATADAHTVFPRRFDLPPGFQPEGIAIGGGPTAWFGSRVDGDIYRVDLRTGRGKVVSQGPGTATVGVK